MKKYQWMLAVLLILSSVLAACGATPEPVTIIETVEVEKEVTIVETVEVEKEVIVDPTECNLEGPAEEVTLNSTRVGIPSTPPI